MISNNFKIEEFVDRVKEKGPGEIMILAREEVREAAGRSYSKKGAVEAREQGSLEYAEILKGLIAFVNGEFRPIGISDRDFQLFRPICDSLIRQGKFSPQALNLFKESAP